MNFKEKTMRKATVLRWLAVEETLLGEWEVRLYLGKYRKYTLGVYMWKKDALRAARKIRPFLEPISLEYFK